MSRSRNNATKTPGRGLGRPFQQGNPGRPKGARHRATLAAEALLDGEAEGLTRKAIETALDGDSVALRLCLDRILPPRRERPVKFALPALMAAKDAVAAMAAIIAAVADGDLSPGEAAEMAKLVETFVRTVEASDLDQRLRIIEAWKDRGDGRGGRQS